MIISPAFKKFISYAGPYRWWIAGATLCGLLKYNIPILFPWVLKDIINQLLYGTGHDMAIVNRYILFLLLIYVLWAVITYLRSYLADRAGQRLIFDLRHDLYVHLQS